MPVICVHLCSSAVNNKMQSIPHSFFPSPVARHSPLTCAAPPALNRPPIPGAEDRVWVFMCKAWVGKWCAVGVPIMNVIPAAHFRLHSAWRPSRSAPPALVVRGLAGAFRLFQRFKGVLN